MSKPVPYWRLSSFYFFYFGLLGCISPYWGLFLDSKGFSAVEIGELMALFGLVRIAAPNLWGFLGDYTGDRLKLLRIGAAICFLIFCAIFWVTDFWGLALIMIGYGFFWAAILPQFEVVTMNYVSGEMDRYSQIRVWGSVGFIVFVWGLGFIFDWLSVTTLPAFMLAILLFILLSSLSVRGEQAEVASHSATEGFLALIFKPHVIAFLVAAILVQISHGAYYTFFSLYLADAGYSKSLIGFLWALGVIAEVIILFSMSKLVRRISYRNLLLVSLALAALRFSLTGVVSDWFFVLAVLQLTHAFTFGAMHSVSMHYVHKYFSGKHQGQGQALFSSLAYGAGGAVGAYYAGIIYTGYSVQIMFLWAGLCSLIGFLIAFRFIPKR